MFQLLLYNVVYFMILWKNCEAELVTQFMYALGLSLCSFSKLGYINTYLTWVSEMFELRFLFISEVLDFIVLNAEYCFSFHYSLISFHQH